MPNGGQIQREWGRVVLGIGGFVLISVLILLVLGATWAALLVAWALLLAVIVLRSLWPSSRPRMVAGELRCPRCDSLQTDRVTRVGPTGGDEEVMHCFACDRDFPDEGALPE